MRTRPGNDIRNVPDVRVVRPVRPLPGARSRIPDARSPRVLPRSFYERPTLVVAEELLGKVLVHRTRHGLASGVIIETEAYIGEDDPACHASFGRTPRNEPLYGPPGLAYVYLNYGVHHLVNAVTEADGHPAAVLIRALQPLDGIALMKKRRATDGRTVDLDDLCRGPGNLTRALGITVTENRRDLTRGAGSEQAGRTLHIEDRGISVGEVAHGPRIGIRVALDRPWRCWVDGHRSVSAHRRRA
jgi:DNA-3-methyladenine glycosylase